MVQACRADNEVLRVLTSSEKATDSKGKEIGFKVKVRTLLTVLCVIALMAAAFTLGVSIPVGRATTTITQTTTTTATFRIATSINGNFTIYPTPDQGPTYAGFSLSDLMLFGMVFVLAAYVIFRRP
jgi:asparagine N-glycosylation enzyme membrane subunit Stt3